MLIYKKRKALSPWGIMFILMAKIQIITKPFFKKVIPVCWNFIFLQQRVKFLQYLLWYFNHHGIFHTISLILNDIQLKNYIIYKMSCQINNYPQDMRIRIIPCSVASGARTRNWTGHRISFHDEYVLLQQ